MSINTISCFTKRSCETSDTSSKRTDVKPLNSTLFETIINLTYDSSSQFYQFHKDIIIYIISPMAFATKQKPGIVSLDPTDQKIQIIGLHNSPENKEASNILKRPTNNHLILRNDKTFLIGAKIRAIPFDNESCKVFSSQGSLSDDYVDVSSAIATIDLDCYGDLLVQDERFLRKYLRKNEGFFESNSKVLEFITTDTSVYIFQQKKITCLNSSFVFQQTILPYEGFSIHHYNAVDSVNKKIYSFMLNKHGFGSSLACYSFASKTWSLINLSDSPEGYPFSLNVDNTGNLLVGYHYELRLYETDGNLLRIISLISDKVPFSNGGVNIDASGRIYVVNQLKNEIFTTL